MRLEAGGGVPARVWLTVRVQGRTQLHTSHTRKAVRGHDRSNATQEASLQPKPLIN